MLLTVFGPLLVSRASFFRVKKFVEANPLSDLEAAARKLIELANGVEAAQERRIEKVNGRFLFEVKGTREQYRAGVRHAIERDRIILRDSGTYLKSTQAAAELFAENGQAASVAEAVVRGGRELFPVNVHP